LNEQQGIKEIRGNKNIPIIKWKWKLNFSEPLQHGKDCVKRELYTYKCLHQNNKDFK
jgi:hypothetical protein